MRKGMRAGVRDVLPIAMRMQALEALNKISLRAMAVPPAAVARPAPIRR
ncbi:hypothetical protein [Micromonospora sp. 15K316]|nr:hypothetical protein [Micromonospora sp. 15K316]